MRSLFFFFFAKITKDYISKKGQIRPKISFFSEFITAKPFKKQHKLIQYFNSVCQPLKIHGIFIYQISTFLEVWSTIPSKSPNLFEKIMFTMHDFPLDFCRYFCYVQLENIWTSQFSLWVNCVVVSKKNQQQMQRMI